MSKNLKEIKPTLEFFLQEMRDKARKSFKRAKNIGNSKKLKQFRAKYHF